MTRSLSIVSVSLAILLLASVVSAAPRGPRITPGMPTSTASTSTPTLTTPTTRACAIESLMAAPGARSLLEQLAGRAGIQPRELAMKQLSGASIAVQTSPTTAVEPQVGALSIFPTFDGIDWASGVRFPSVGAMPRFRAGNQTYATGALLMNGVRTTPDMGIVQMNLQGIVALGDRALVALNVELPEEQGAWIISIALAPTGDETLQQQISDGRVSLAALDGGAQGGTLGMISMQDLAGALPDPTPTLGGGGGGGTEDGGATPTIPLSPLSDGTGVVGMATLPRELGSAQPMDGRYDMRSSSVTIFLSVASDNPLLFGGMTLMRL